MMRVVEHLGKIVIKIIFISELTADLHLEFSKKHSISKEMVLKSVYKEDHPNQFLLLMFLFW